MCARKVEDSKRAHAAVDRVSHEREVHGLGHFAEACAVYSFGRIHHVRSKLYSAGYPILRFRFFSFFSCCAGKALIGYLLVLTVGCLSLCVLYRSFQVAAQCLETCFVLFYSLDRDVSRGPLAYGSAYT